MTKALGDLLAYGISGLGLALAILAYLLLKAEQRVPRPRKSIIRTIYAFMVFSVVLVCLGLTFEVGKQWLEAQKPKPAAEVGQIVSNASDELWYDVLPATRKRLFGEAIPREFTRGGQRPDGVYQLDFTLRSGECRDYLAMAKPPALIEVELPSLDNEVVHTQLGKQDHLIYGRLCKAKSPKEFSSVKIVMKFLRGAGVYALETYSATDF